MVGSTTKKLDILKMYLEELPTWDWEWDISEI